MYNIYSVTENRCIGTVVERSRKQETINAINTALNAYYKASILITNIILPENKKGTVKPLILSIKGKNHNINISETNLY